MPALWASSASLLVCTIYSTIVNNEFIKPINVIKMSSINILFDELKGGFRAVLWTDTFQCAWMLIAVCTVLFKGNYDAGGFNAVLNASLNTGRIELFEKV